LDRTEGSVTPLRLAAIGAGFIADWQLAAWKQVPSVEIVALCDSNQDRGRALAKKLRIPTVYASAESMFQAEAIDAVDVLTSPESHLELALLAADRGYPVLCQKPLAPTLEDAQVIVKGCEERGARLMVNENFRWRSSYRWIKDRLNEGALGKIFYASFNMRYNVSYPSERWPNGLLFTQRPFLLSLEKLIILESTVHWIDIARFLFGEPGSVYCQTQQGGSINVGEDTVVIVMAFEGATAVIQNGWSSHGYAYPVVEAAVAIEGTEATIFVESDGRARLVRHDGTVEMAEYDLSTYYISSFVRCQTHFAECLATGETFSTSGEDNLLTLAATFGAYRSAELNQVVSLPSGR
jgi:D-apiose dehydrogenase